MRDNTVVASLRSRGRDVHLIPLYTPIRTDEADVSESPIYYGGVNVYMQQKSAFFRHTPWLLDRLLDWPALLRSASRLSNNTSPELLGQLTCSMLHGKDGAQRKELAKLIDGLGRLRVDLVHLPNAMFVGLAAPIKEALGVPIVCTLTGEDIFLDTLPEPYRGDSYELIRSRSRDVDAFISVTQYYATFSRERFRIDEARLHVVPLGVKVNDVAAPPAEKPDPFTIGYLARICPEKGLHMLGEAFDLLRAEGRSCRLIAAGYLPQGEKRYLESIRGHLADQGHGENFEYRGEVDRAEKEKLLHEAHVFSVPTVYHESKGLYVLEALAAGVPVVQPRHGSFPELIDQTGGGLLVDPEDPRALADGFAALMDDPPRRRALGCQGRRSVLESFTDERMADRVWDVFERCADNAFGG